MKIGIVSDSHDNVPMADAAVAAFRDKGAERLIHAGDFVAPFAVKRFLALDVPIVAVFGNCDGEHKVISELLPDIVEGARHETIDGRHFVVVHAAEWLDDADREAADVIVCGHTHEVAIDEAGPLVINPGECGGWMTGRSTAAMLDTETLAPEVLELSE
ncbi:MAG: metallophosphoesterase [Planctomycetota bacterium]